MYLVIKRFLDVVLSFIAVILCLIPMAIVAVLVKMDSKGPVLFKQKRVGKEFFTKEKDNQIRIEHMLYYNVDNACLTMGTK